MAKQRIYVWRERRLRYVSNECIIIVKVHWKLNLKISNLSVNNLFTSKFRVKVFDFKTDYCQKILYLIFHHQRAELTLYDLSTLVTAACWNIYHLFCVCSAKSDILTFNHQLAFAFIDKTQSQQKTDIYSRCLSHFKAGLLVSISTTRIHNVLNK